MNDSVYEQLCFGVCTTLFMNNSVSVDAQLCFDGYMTVFWWMHDCVLVDARLCFGGSTTLFWWMRDYVLVDARHLKKKSFYSRLYL